MILLVHVIEDAGKGFVGEQKGILAVGWMERGVERGRSGETEAKIQVPVGPQNGWGGDHKNN